MSEQMFFAQTSDETLQHHQVTPTGLSPEEANKRLQRHGANRLPREDGVSLTKLIFQQINNPLIWVLIASGLLALALGKGTDGIVVLGVVLVNGILGFVQEYRAGKAIASLQSLVAENATVIRNNEKISIPAADLVPGDIVVIQAGDKTPADLRLIDVRTLLISEAALTGESVPVEKHSQPVPSDTGLADRRNMAFSSTMVTAGYGLGVVVGTGLNTEIGKIETLIKSAEPQETPLTRSMGIMAKKLSIWILAIAAVMCGVAIWRGAAVTDALMVGITLAVAAIPEGLPAIITIALAIGVKRMADRRAVIRCLPAVETLGSTTVICSDKTGTITRNEMTVTQLWTDTGQYSVTGTGYGAEGTVLASNQPLTEMPDSVQSLLIAGLLCNDSSITWQTPNDYTITGDPTEIALLVAGKKAGLSQADYLSRYPRQDVLPFESENQYMVASHQIEGETVLVMKGGPEVVLQRCNQSLSGLPLQSETVTAAIHQMASQGMRVLGFAQKIMTDPGDRIQPDQLVSGWSFLGLQGMIDPPRTEAIAAVHTCRTAGITVKMITGDHKSTAAAIGRQLGIITSEDQALSGKELTALSDRDLKTAINHIHVFARVAPEQKLRLVKALQEQRQVVAMTGDGVNDAPALKQSDIGVAMGITGTAVSREAADVVLTDDNFASIAAAVEEGRRVYDNLIKALTFVLPTNLGEALILLVAVAFMNISEAMPLAPVQILWINLAATIALALPLAFEAPESNLMNRQPRNPDEPLLNRFVMIRTGVVAVLLTLIALMVFSWQLPTGLAYAQTVTLNTVVFFQIFYLINCRSINRSILSVGIFTNNTVYAGIALILILQAGLIYTPFMNQWFHTVPLDIGGWGISFLCGLVILPVISIEKWWRRSR